MYTYQTADSFTRFTKYEKHELQEIYNTYDFMKYKIPLFKDDETIEYILFDLKEDK